MVGTYMDYAGYNAESDANELRGAMKGMGTDEQVIIDVLTRCSNAQRQETIVQYKQMFGRSLVDDLKSELSSHFEKVIVGLCKTPAEYDAYCLYKAMKGAGTDEKALIEILCSRTNAEIIACKEVYKKTYGKDLEAAIKGDTSGDLKHLLVALCQASRSEDGACSVQAAEDVAALIEAGEAQWGTDESRFNAILCQRSYEQIKAIFQLYQDQSEKSLDEAIKSEFSGDMQKGLLAIVLCAFDRVAFFTEEVYKSMKGLGTDDTTLVRIIVSRSEFDLQEIKDLFAVSYGQTLEAFIEDDCSGDYKKALLAICRGNKH